MHLIRQRKLFAAFIDFKSAFSSTDHTLLFSKMFDFGISAKMISLIRKIYKNAKTKVRVGNEVTESRSISKGLLEGDCLSPVAFIIFINDLE